MLQVTIRMVAILACIKFVPFTGPKLVSSTWQVPTTSTAVRLFLVQHGRTEANSVPLAFQVKTSELWRDFGILIVFLIFFQLYQMYEQEVTEGGAMPMIAVFERENAERKVLNQRLQERKEAAKRGELEQDMKGLIRARRPFTWERLSYSVPVPGGQKRLLNDIYGYVLVSGRSIWLGQDALICSCWP